MRPRRLEVTGFGPFADKVEINFEDLAAGGSLLLIHGQTGGGKTTLLDAMCYALYGDTSGGERNFREMKSHHAPQDAYTEVSFEFSIRDRRYRVQRRFKIGGVTYKSKVALEVLEQGAATYRSLSTKATEVAQQIEGILGLDKQQFRQVVMLPQGQFREFLTAGSREREAILTSLFDTERFGVLEDALKSASTDVQGRLGRAMERRALALERSGHGNLDGVRAEHAELERAHADHEARLASLSAARDEHSARLSAARALLLRFDQADRARARLAQLDDERDVQRARGVRIEAARRAREVAPVERAASAAMAAAQDGEARAAQVAADLERVRQVAEASRGLLAVELDRVPERDALAARAQDLSRARADVAAAGEAAALYGEAEVALRLARESLATHIERASRLSRAEVQAKELAARSQRSAEQRSALELEVERAEAEASRAARRAALESQLASASGALTDADERAREAEREHTRAARASVAAEERWLAGLRAELAAHLVDGEACPVCGADEHPAPAPHDHGGLARETRDAARTDERRSREALERARLTRSRVEGELELARGGLAELKDAPAQVEAEARLRAHRAELAAALEDAAQLAAREAALAKVSASLDEARVQVHSAEEALTERERQRAAAQAVLEVQRARLPEGAETIDALDRACEHLDARIRAMDEAKDRARARSTALDAQVAELRGQLETARAEEARLRAAAQEAEAAWERARDRAGLGEGYELARADVAELPELERAHAEHAAGVESQRAQLEDALAEIADRPRPDEGPLARALEEVHAAVAEANRALGQLRERASLMSTYVAELEGAEAEVDRCRARDDVVGRLARVASGDHPGRITFQRFVLGALLDDVLGTASARLSLMTRGRYRLKRGAESRKRARGLDLAVIDAYTGTERPVQTLSGGESFLAALSLALGLADAVQARAGGLELEAIFVDEGFGGLDPEALDLAMDALSRLKDAGRLVGIISHVEELKERVESRVEVVPSRSGSELRFFGSLAT